MRGALVLVGASLLLLLILGPTIAGPDASALKIRILAVLGTAGALVGLFAPFFLLANRKR